MDTSCLILDFNKHLHLFGGSLASNSSRILRQREPERNSMSAEGLWREKKPSRKPHVLSVLSDWAETWMWLTSTDPGSESTVVGTASRSTSTASINRLLWRTHGRQPSRVSQPVSLLHHPNVFDENLHTQMLTYSVRDLFQPSSLWCPPVWALLRLAPTSASSPQDGRWNQSAIILAGSWPHVSIGYISVIVGQHPNESGGRPTPPNVKTIIGTRH